MNVSIQCASCGMPIESGPYCDHCTDDAGNLHAFEERFERMKQWSQRENPDWDAATTERNTLQYMSTMPAWKDNAKLKEMLGS